MFLLFKIFSTVIYVSSTEASVCALPAAKSLDRVSKLQTNSYIKLRQLPYRNANPIKNESKSEDAVFTS